MTQTTKPRVSLAVVLESRQEGRPRLDETKSRPRYMESNGKEVMIYKMS